MEKIGYIAAIIAALAFVIVVIYFVITLKVSNQTLHNVVNTLESLDKQMQGITDETTQLLTKTN
uniref:DUF948 domain-containing protein n=1 Tax=Virgibacillus massiliensis TaxID=1462526 RepID=UPI0018E179C6